MGNSPGESWNRLREMFLFWVWFQLGWEYPVPACWFQHHLDLLRYRIGLGAFLPWWFWPTYVGEATPSFRSWCYKVWPETNLQHSSSGSNGYYDHSELLLLRSQHQTARANKLENKFYTFLRDLNLSYSSPQILFNINGTAQTHTFLRFAAAFENILEEALEETPKKGHGLSEEMASMSLNQWKIFRWYRSGLISSQHVNGHSLYESHNAQGDYIFVR